MDDLDRLLAETMRDAAGRAPADDGLLSTVHRRSDRLRRQRIATTLSAAAAVLAVAVPTVLVLANRTPAVPPPAAVPAISASPSATPPATASPTSSPTPSKSSPPPPTTPAVHLATGWTAPTFPYALAASAGLKAPVASMNDGDLIGFFEAAETQHHADTTVTVSRRKPPSSGTSVQVRGHTGTLRTVDVQPAKQLILTWQESPGHWIQLATDDTYTPPQVVALADGLTSASTAVLPPFQLDRSPAGFVTDTVTASTMTFRTSASAPDTEMVKTVLHKHRPLTGTNQKVGSYRALLTHAGGRVTLDVDVTDWNATLEVTVGSGLTMSDADLLRFAAGVHILNRSNPE
jgi:hypothetical protein